MQMVGRSLCTGLGESDPTSVSVYKMQEVVGAERCFQLAAPAAAAYLK